MPIMSISIEILHSDGAGEVELDIEFTHSPGSPAHMGSLSYPGHPAEPAEIGLEHIYWPYARPRRKDEIGHGEVIDHIDMPYTALPTNVLEAIETEIIEKYEPDHFDESH